MARKGISGGKLFITVVYFAVICRAVPVSDLLERASQRSDEMHSLSTLLTQEMVSHSPHHEFQMADCHTYPLETPNDKMQALQESESTLMSQARSLLNAWMDPLKTLSDTAIKLSHPAKRSISSRIQELQDHSKSLADGLDILSSKMGPDAQKISPLPYTGGTDLGQDQETILKNFIFLLSCLNRDSHKIDNFLKVLRCRAANLESELC